jgi:putative hydrolase of the HAD superfamily
MGGVIVRDHNIWPELMPYLGLTEKNLSEIDVRLHEALVRHSRGEIRENDFWRLYTEITGRTIPPGETESLLGKFFYPKTDDCTAQIVKQLKGAGMRVLAGTNVIESHYNAHIKLHQYDLFDKVYASHLMGVAKPDPAFYEYIIKAEGIQAQDIFFTDDTIENVNAAAGAGLCAFHYTDARTMKNQLLSLGLPDCPT